MQHWGLSGGQWLWSGHWLRLQMCRDHFVNAPRQWETLQCNVSYWLSAFTKRSLDVSLGSNFNINEIITFKSIPWEKIGHRDCSPWAHGELTASSQWAHGDQNGHSQPWLSCDVAVTEPWSYWRCRDWAVTSPWLSCDLAVTELWPRRDWTVTSPSRDHWAPEPWPPWAHGDHLFSHGILSPVANSSKDILLWCKPWALIINMD